MKQNNYILTYRLTDLKYPLKSLYNISKFTNKKDMFDEAKLMKNRDVMQAYDIHFYKVEEIK